MRRFQRLVCKTVLFFAAGAPCTSLSQDSLSSHGSTEDLNPRLLDGKFLYEQWAECASCHAVDGTGSVEGLELDPPPPDFTDCSFTSREPSKDWFAVIKHGGPVRGLSSTMPEYNEAITNDQIDAIIDYIKTFCSEEGWPPGELNFRRPLVTNKAFPENEALFIPTYTNAHDDQITSKFVYERRFGKRAHWEISLPLATQLGGSSNFGAGDIELGVKYVLADNLQRQSILSGGVDLALPTGKTELGIGDGSWALAPFLAAAKGFGTFSLQSSMKLEVPVATDGRDTELLLNLAATFPFTREKKGVHAMLEMNIVKVLENNDASLFLTPQVYVAPVKKGHVAFSVGSQIPMAGHKPFDYRLLFFLLWEYADGGLWW